MSSVTYQRVTREFLPTRNLIGNGLTSECSDQYSLTKGIPGGHWSRKGVWGCAALKTPFPRLSCSSQGSHFKQKSEFTRPPLWENLEILASTSLIFAQILAFQPQNLKILGSQAPKLGNFQFTSPPFQRQISVRKPHTLEIRVAHPYLKKAECPPHLIGN